MAYTQDDVDALKAAYKTGALRVRYSDGREVLYRTREEIKAILRDMDEEVNPPASTSRVSYAYYSRD